MFFLDYQWIAAFVAAVTQSGSKTILASGGSKLFINGKPTLMNKLRNLPFWFITFSIVAFNEILLFSKDLITLIISFISLLLNVTPELSFVVKFY